MKCAWCGSMLTAAGLDQYQCLACGKQTNADGTRAIAMTSPSAPILVPADLHAGDEFAGQDRRYRPGDTEPMPPVDGPTPTVETTSADVAPPAPAPDPEPEASVVVPAPAAPVPEPVDLSALSPEQVAAIELIAHPES